VRLWGTEKGQLVRMFNQHTDHVNATVWLGCDPTKFITGGIDKSLYIMEVEGKVILHRNVPRISSLAVSQGGDLLVAIPAGRKSQILV